jgi:glycosyltransferase involved in cell wall biosynthesis
MKNILYLGNKLSHHGFTKTGIETLGIQLENEGLKVYYAGTKKSSVLRITEMLWSIMRYFSKIDYVLIDSYSSTAFWYAWLSGMLCRLLRVEYIHILRGGSLPIRLQRSKWFCNQIFLHSYANVAVSGYMKDAFDKAGYPTVVIPNNIDISMYPYKKRQVIKPRLLWVRSFHRQYNPNMAADVLGMLLKDYADAELCMVGPDKDGSMQEFKNYCNQLGITEHVKVTGLLSKPEWHTLSEDYDIFINTTHVDNTPVSVIEAMALGLTVVSTNVGGLPFLLVDGKDALLVNKGDAEAMYKAVKDIIIDQALATEIAGNARAKAESFDWENIKSQWFSLLS